MKISLEDILTEDFISKFQESFALSTGFGVVFVDLEGNHIGAGSNFSRLCQEINKSSEGRAYCARTNRNAIEIALKTKKPSIYICHAGLVNIEIPLTYEGKYIGAITAGQVKCSDPNAFPQDSPSMNDFLWLKTDEAKDFLSNMKTLSKSEIEATAVSLQNIANYIVQTVMFNKMQENLAEERRKVLEFEKKYIEMEHRLKSAELSALQKQVTPHFLFNALSSISRLISLEEPEKAKNMIDSLTKMLRYSLNITRSMIPLQEEINYIVNYLNIQKVRFGERVSFEIHSDEGIDLEIPYFSLQPIIENALEHGILELPEGGHISIECLNHDDCVEIKISDNGIGMNKDKLDEIKRIIEMPFYSGNKNIGLRNSIKRYFMYFEDRFSYEINSINGEGTVIVFKIEKVPKTEKFLN